MTWFTLDKIILNSNHVVMVNQNKCTVELTTVTSTIYVPYETVEIAGEVMEFLNELLLNSGNKLDD
jgi:hypothetical protein